MSVIIFIVRRTTFCVSVVASSSVVYFSSYNMCIDVIQIHYFVAINMSSILCIRVWVWFFCNYLALTHNNNWINVKFYVNFRRRFKYLQIHGYIHTCIHAYIHTYIIHTCVRVCVFKYLGADQNWNWLESVYNQKLLDECWNCLLDLINSSLD